LLRIAAYVHQEQGRLDEAAEAYEAVVAAFPDDFESWNNLGNVRATLGALEPAIEAVERALNLRPDIVPLHLHMSELLARVERHDVRRRLMRAAAARHPADAEVQAELGLAEAGMADNDSAERAFRKAIRLSAGFTPAYLELGLLLENLNRIERALCDHDRVT